MPNLLQCAPLLNAQGLAEVYVVYDEKDYRMTLATLISLVTKAALGLENVDNTSDLNKPIPRAVTDALVAKANKDAVPTLTAFNALANSLQGYVTNTQLNQAVSSITQALNGYVTQTQLSAAVTQAITPVTQALAAINQQFGVVEQRISALEQINSNAVTIDVMNLAIGSAVATLQQNLSDISQSFSETLQLFNTRVLATESAITGLQSSKADSAHTHTANSITQLSEFVVQIVESNGGNVKFASAEW